MNAAAFASYYSGDSRQCYRWSVYIRLTGSNQNQPVIRFQFLAFEQPIKPGLFLIVDGLIMDNHTEEIT